MFKKYEKEILTSAILIFFSIQVLLVSFIDLDHTSDSAYYLETAFKTVETGNLYPASDNLNDRWIRSPGWVNLMALLLYLTGTVKGVLFFNIIFNIIILCEVYYISRKYFGLESAMISLLLFMLLLSNYGIVLFLLSELITVALVLGSVCLAVQNRPEYFLLSGILAGIANWVRPIAPALFITLIISSLVLRFPVKHIFIWLSGLLVIVMLIGGLTYIKCGKFIFSSITTGGNMIIGANPQATGRYDTISFSKDGAAFIADEDNLSVRVKDKIWRKRALEWKLKNPKNWLSLIPKKFYYLYSSDRTFLKYFRSDSKTIPVAESLLAKIIHYPAIFINNVIYLFILFMSLLSIYFTIRDENSAACIVLIYIIVLSAMTCIAFGDDRFHYPMIPAMIILASFSIGNLWVNSFKSRLPSKE